ncbi:MAG: ABC transporter [Euryarchaeota archaeon]|nr:ABC transporter [Euryarchaeota archaeon]
MVRGDAPLRRLITHMSSHRKTVWLASTCSVVNRLFDLAPPVLIGAAVDVVVRGEDSVISSIGIVNVHQQLWFLAAITFLIWGFESLFQYLYGVLWRNLAQTVQHELRLDVYGHIQNLEMGWFLEQSKGNLMAIMNDDVNQLERFLDEGATDLLHVATTVIVISALFFIIDWRVALFSIAPIPLILWGSFRFQSRIAPRYADVRMKAGNIGTLLENNLTGITTIKSFTGEDREFERLRITSEDYCESNRSAIKLSASFVPLIRMAILIGFTATLLLGGELTLNGTIEVGEFSILVFMTQRLLWPLTRLGATFDLYQRAMASTSRVLNLLETEISMKDGDKILSNVKGRVSTESLSFAYPERDSTIEDVNIEIPAGSTVAIVGPTGSGKTTIVRLLLRFYDPNNGSIKVDGIDVRELKLSSLRQSIALVSQRVTLFPESVKENIRYGNLDATDEEIENAAEIAEAIEFIDTLPHGFDTKIGEGGYKLSGGQRQRLSIARAVLKDAPILILDEATSSVDNETEAALQRSLAQISEGRTTLIIAHRLSTIRNADNIFVLENGKVIESGTHDNLVLNDHMYKRLWDVQTGMQDKKED